MELPEGITQEADLIDAMCLTWRHDFGLPFMGDSDGFRSGLSAQERDGLRLQMRQLYEHHIKPAIQSAVEAETNRCAAKAIVWVLAVGGAAAAAEALANELRKGA